MPDRTVPRGTRISGLEEVLSKAPDSKSTTPVDGMSWRPTSTLLFRGTVSGYVPHVDAAATSKDRGNVTLNQTDINESMIARNRNAGVARIDQVEPFRVGRRVGNKRCSVM